MKTISLDNFRQYHNLLMQYIDKRIDLSQNGTTNCPNCGAVITDKQCSYCGTNLIKWYEVK